MPFVAIPQVSKVTFEMNLGGIPFFNVCYLHTSFIADSADVASLADTLYALWVTGTQDAMVNAVHYVSCEVVAQDTSSAPSSTFFGIDHGAAGAGAAFPMNVCMVASMHVPTRYRGGHSRLYLSGIPETVLADPSHFVAGTCAARAADLEAFRVAANAAVPPSGATVEIGTVHRKRGGVTLTPPEFEAWSGVTMNNTIGTQRRRLR